MDFLVDLPLYLHHAHTACGILVPRSRTRDQTLPLVVGMQS